jgi:hypothetical protein
MVERSLGFFDFDERLYVLQIVALALLARRTVAGIARPANPHDRCGLACCEEIDCETIVSGGVCIAAAVSY